MTKIIYGDITKLNVDVIVNAANESLQHGGGVAKAIANVAGEKLVEESNKSVMEKGPLKTGEARETSAGNLKAKYVIHVVGPRGTDEKKLGQAINNVFKLAIKLKAKSIALPAVSCGVFGFDEKKGAESIYKVAKDYEKDMEIYLVSIDKEIIGYWEECFSE